MKELKRLLRRAIAALSLEEFEQRLDSTQFWLRVELQHTEAGIALNHLDTCTICLRLD
ncbi:hypothetical protein H6F43_15775 [Leptolyngbya sp. FACHB-36]|uniref:hypothetical protein n=1 Tax=Leptolyngbya sp. FACHB-36 TaxID=2692808 RepID=UPI0016810C7F|nr:hypothetical protein [Leptolyngbya sp. FACHB-36]MBD2021639.1 hypothetical protein [Leptolyngbya sp. FACHB-36]